MRDEARRQKARSKISNPSSKLKIISQYNIVKEAIKMPFLSRNSITLLLSLLHSATLTEGHALWQQNVALAGDEGSDITTYFTFAESPGLDHAERESMAKRAYENSIKLHYADVTDAVEIEDVEYQTLEPLLDGKYITADVPDAGAEAFVLEGYVNWGVFGEPGRFPPSLIHFYTSASYYSSDKWLDIVEVSSKNQFRVHLRMVKNISNEQMCTGDEGTCLRATVTFQKQPMSGHAVDIIMSKANGDQEKVSITTGDDGFAFLPCDTDHQRIFARVKHGIDTPGVTPYGDEYEAVSHIATTALELHPNFNTQFKPTGSDTSDDEASNKSGVVTGVDTFTFVIIALISFAASFLGASLSARLNDRRGFVLAQQVEEFYSCSKV